MKKTILFALAMVICLACKQDKTTNESPKIDVQTEKTKINELLDSLNTAAAKADFNTYFSLYSEDAIFTGTDATERWDKAAFKIWAKPIFDKGKAWNFNALERHIYLDSASNFAWFDELLNTQMKICRGSGVVVKENNKWKIKQYILSTTIPNDKLDPVIKIKAPIEDLMIKNLSKK